MPEDFVQDSNAHRTMATFDGSGSVSVLGATVTTRTLADGREIVTHVDRDGVVVIRSVEDLDDQFVWTSQITVINTRGQLRSQTILDDGTSIFRGYDVDGNLQETRWTDLEDTRDWTTRAYFIDEERGDSIQITMDDGREINRNSDVDGNVESIYRYDADDAHDWRSRNYLDREERGHSLHIFMDDGREFYRHYDADGAPEVFEGIDRNDAFAWTSWIEFYSADGGRSISLYMDDGREIYRNYDADGNIESIQRYDMDDAVAWTTREYQEISNFAGQRFFVDEVIYDDGREVSRWYDENGELVLFVRDDRYDAEDGFDFHHVDYLPDGTVVDARGWDNGIRAIRTYDEDGTLSHERILDTGNLHHWATREFTYDADGLLLTEVTVLDGDVAS